MSKNKGKGYKHNNNLRKRLAPKDPPKKENPIQDNYFEPIANEENDNEWVFVTKINEEKKAELSR